MLKWLAILCFSLCFPAANMKVVLSKGFWYTGAGHNPVQLTCAYRKFKQTLN